MDSEKKSGARIDKLNALVQQELSGILPPYLEGESAIVTITKVAISQDLKWAKVWISILGGDDKTVLTILKNNIYAIQGELNRILPTKVLPRLQFCLDPSSRYAARINELLEELHKEKKD